MEYFNHSCYFILLSMPWSVSNVERKFEFIYEYKGWKYLFRYCFFHCSWVVYICHFISRFCYLNSELETHVEIIRWLLQIYLFKIYFRLSFIFIEYCLSPLIYLITVFSVYKSFIFLYKCPPWYEHKQKEQYMWYFNSTQSEIGLENVH